MPCLRSKGASGNELAIVFIGISGPRQGELLEIAQADHTVALLSCAAQRREEQCE